MFSANAALIGMAFPCTHVTRNACFPSMIHVPLHTFHYRDACFLDCSATLIADVAIAIKYIINKDQVQIKLNEAITIRT